MWQSYFSVDSHSWPDMLVQKVSKQSIIPRSLLHKASQEDSKSKEKQKNISREKKVKNETIQPERPAPIAIKHKRREKVECVW